MRGENARDYYEQPTLWDHCAREDEERIAKIAQMVPDDVETVLDLGCGSGLFVRELSQSKWVVGLDWSREALSKLPGNAVLGEIQQAPFKGASFDMVVCSEVLEHLYVEVFAGAVNEMVRLTRGWLLMTVPYEENLEAYFSKCADCGCVYHAHRHVRSFTLELLRTFFPDFEVAKWEAFGKVEWVGRLEAKIWHGIGGHWVATETCQCPQCGSRKKVTPDRGLRDLTGLAVARIVRLFHAPSKPRWLLVLMKRKPLVS